MRFNEVIKRRVRLGLAIALALLTLAAFIYYLPRHSYLITKLGQTSPLTLIELAMLYVAWFAALWIIVLASLVICKKTLGIKEGFLLNSYSTLFNFFVPGQGGIAVRGMYLKKNKNLGLGKFVFVTLIYYMFYAIVSAGLLLGDNRPWWQTLGVTLIIGGLSLGIIYIYKKRGKTKTGELDLSVTTLTYLMLATLFQAIVQIVIYAVELHSVNSNISLRQIITYTGAANFALFAALTPGAIGIRESFLIFSRNLHHITIANIVAANVIDRAIFIVFLGLLFLLTVSFHAKNKFSVKQIKVPIETGDKV